MSMMRELFKDLGKYSPLVIIQPIVIIIVLPIITRLFSPEDYGNYILVMTTVSVLSLIAVAWLGSSTIRFLSVYELRNELDKFHSTVIKLTLISIGIICVIFLGIFSSVQARISANLYSLMRIGILVFIATSFFRVFLELLRARHQAAWYTSFSIWQNVTGFGFSIALVIAFNFGVEALLLGFLISTIIILPLMWKISLGKPSLTEGNVLSPMSWEMAKYGIPAMGINLLTWVLSLSDRYILKFFRGSQEVGIYSASYVISERSIFLITSLFLLPSVPIALNIWGRQGIKASQEFVKKLTRYYLLIGFPATLGLSLLAKPIIDVFIAPEYLSGYRIIPLVALGAFLVGITHRFTLGLVYYKRTDMLMLCFVGSGLLNIGLNFIFIPRYGYMAAGITTFVSYAFLLLLIIFVSRRFFVWDFPFKSLAKVICASAIMGVVVYYIGNSLTSSALTNIILAIGIGLVIYFGLLFLLGEFQPQEIQELVSFKTRIFGKIK